MSDLRKFLVVLLVIVAVPLLAIGVYHSGAFTHHVSTSKVAGLTCSSGRAIEQGGHSAVEGLTKPALRK